MQRQLEIPISRADERSRIVARWLTHLEECLGDDGAICFARALRGAGITREALQEEKGLETAQLEDVIRIARRERPDCRLQLMRSLQVPDIGIMGFAAMSSDTIDKALEITISYHELTSSRHDLELFENGEDAIIRPIVKLMYLHDIVDIAEDSMAGMWRLLELFLGAGMVSEFERAGAHFEHAEPTYVNAYADAFKCCYHFDAEHTELRFPAEWLKLPVATANPAVGDLCRSMCERILGSRQDRASISDEIVRLLLSRSNRRIPGLEKAASSLNMSQSQLRKRLYREGTSYKRVVAETRMVLAKNYLETSRLTIQNIAYLLDYTEAAAFTRAFKREIGVSPFEYRRNVPSGVENTK